MSKIKTVIEIEPPGFPLSEREIQVGPMLCGYCHGEGSFVTPGDPYGSERVACTECGGSGMVRATVSIRWSGLSLVGRREERGERKENSAASCDSSLWNPGDPSNENEK